MSTTWRKTLPQGRVRAYPRGESSDNIPLSSPLCRECGGRRMIRSSAGYLPCPTCVPWSQRPDYIPGKLISNKDLDLIKIENQKNKDAQGEGVDKNGDGKKRRKRGRQVMMTEARRLAIKNAMQNRGPLDEGHKRKISNSIRNKYAQNPHLRQKGRPKKCSVCGEEGHNKKTCPQVLSLQTDTSSDKSDKRRTVKCSVCGEEGHNRKSCPHNKESLSLREDKKNESPTDATQKPFVDTILAAEVPQIQPSIINSNNNTNRTERSYEEFERPLRSLRGTNVSVATDGSILFPLPARQDQCVQQASAAVRRAWEDGVKRQCLELLLPQANSVVDGGWPGGIKQQFRAALPMIESLLLILKNVDGLEGRITAEFLDEVDCIGAWQSEKLAAVVFPTADTIPSLQRIDDALSGKRLTMIINPQWQLNGQVISDFGFGKYRKQAEAFVNSLEYVYFLKRMRIMGDEVRILRCYPGFWQVYCMGDSARDSRLLAVEKERPTYDQILKILRSDQRTRASKSWIDRFLDGKNFDEIATFSDEGSERVVKEDVDIVTGDIIAGE